MKGLNPDFISRFVRTLDQTDRYLLMMFYAEGLDTSEISLVLDQPEFRITNRLHEIKERTKAALHQHVVA